MKIPFYENSPLDFTKLTDREFEEIIYYYFKDQIEAGLYHGIYTKVELMPGVAEQGFDCQLYNNADLVGCVQCKNYKKNISPSLIIDEIIKFALYHLSETGSNFLANSSIIPDISQFKYYFVASKGFSKNSTNLLSNFNREVSLMLKTGKIDLLERAKVITRRNGLDISGPHIESGLQYVFENLQVESLSGIDIDPIIRSNSDIVNRYFEIKKVIDEDTSQYIKQTLNEIKKSVSQDELGVTNLFSEADRISEDILQVKNYFGDNSETNIKRPVVKDIFNWIKNPIGSDNNNLAIISGNAGMGKSVILRQLYELLNEADIPSLCLKADRLAFDTLSDLESEINIDIGAFVENVIDNYEVIVLIIDQIDALSQTLSSNLKPLKAYDRLIRKFVNQPKVKIVVSCRIYELNYDPIISNYKKKKSFLVEPIPREKLLTFLEASSINHSGFSETLFHLLSTPLHLDIFLGIYQNNVSHNELHNIQDLYNELWKQRIVDNKSSKQVEVEFENVVDLVFLISLKMYEAQKISISSAVFEDKYIKELKYLVSEGIVKWDKRIEFFHQSFFDYGLARRFVSEEKDLIEDIKKRHQGLFIRSKVRQVISYLRGVDIDQYVEVLKSMLSDEQIRFHIKLLLLQEIGFQNDPDRQEVQFIVNLINENEEIKRIFLTLYLGIGWFKVIVDHKLIEYELLKETVGESSFLKQVLGGFIGRLDSQLIDFLYEYKSSDGIEDLAHYVFRGVKSLENPKSLNLLELLLRSDTSFVNQLFLLDKAVTNHFDWVGDKLIELLNITKNQSSDRLTGTFPGEMGGYTAIYDKLWTSNPKKAYLLIKKMISILIEANCFESDSKYFFKLDKIYYSYVRKNLDHNLAYQQLDKLQSYLVEEYNNDSTFISTEIKGYLSSDFTIYIAVGLSAIQKFIGYFIPETFKLLTDSERLAQLFVTNEYLKFLILDVLGKAYTFFSNSEKQAINNLILNFKTANELVKYEAGKGKESYSKNYGISKYQLLEALGEEHRGQFSILSEKYLELQRKFDTINLKEPEGVVVSFGSGRTLKESAYANMTFEDWKNTFVKYSNERFNHRDTPSEFEHGRIFEQEVKRNPNKYVDLVSQIVEDEKIPNSYKVRGIQGLKEIKYDPVKLAELFIKAIDSNEFNEEHTLYLVWASRYFAESRLTNSRILEFLELNALSGGERAGIFGDDINAGINSVRGASVDALMSYEFNSETHELIFDVLNKVALNSNSATRSCAVYKLQYFLKSQREQALELFLKLTHDYSPGILKVSLFPLQYMISSNFAELIPFLQKAIQFEGSNEMLGNVLTRAYCFNYSGADELLNEFYNRGIDQIHSSLKIALKFIQYTDSDRIGDGSKRAIGLLERFLEVDNKEIAESYRNIFYHLNERHFNSLLPFIRKYCSSKMGQIRGHAFYGFLLKCSGDYPKECIELAGMVDTIDSTHQYNDLLRTEPLNVIIHSYNAVREYGPGIVEIETAMDEFDRLLQNDNYRLNATKFLNALDSY